MKNIQYKVSRWPLVLLAAFCSLAGCKKSFLSPNPMSFYTPDVAFKTPDALMSVLANCEVDMRYEYFSYIAPLITEMIFSDEAVFGKTDGASPAQNMNLSITPDAQLNDGSYNRIGWYWDQSYIDIKDANSVLAHIDEPTYESDAQKNAIKGAAYFFRAYRYYYLCNQFGDVPWVGKEIEGPKLDFYSTKREVILQQIKQDLDSASDWVPDNVDKGDVTKGAVLQLLTQVNLALGDFDDAIASASRIINGGVYHLMTARFGSDEDDPTKNVTWDLHRPENKSLSENKEALMLTIDRYNTTGNYSGGSNLMYAHVSNWYASINTPNGNKGTSDAQGIEYDQSTKFGRGAAQCRGTWYSTHEIWSDDPGDYRHTPGNWVTMEDLVYNNPSLKGKDPYYGKHLQLYSDQGKILCSDTIRSWFQWPAYKFYIPDKEHVKWQGGHTDWYVYRLAGTYLLRAEAYVWKGDLADAAADINVVRARANAAPIDPSQITIATILDERARELYFEEHRKSELTRIAFLFAQTGKTAYNGKTYKLDNFSDDNFWYDRIMEKTEFYNKGVKTNYGNEFKISPYHVLWPVPSHVINANSQGVINQNKGYTGYEKNVPPLTKITD